MVAERIRQSMADDTSVLPDGQAATVSADVVEVEPGSRDIHRAIQAADTALYRAKNEGRNCVVRAT